MGFDGSAVTVVLYLVIWAIPIFLAVWFIWTLTAMARAQQEIADRLAGIETSLRAGSQPPVA